MRYISQKSVNKNGRYGPHPPAIPGSSASSGRPGNLNAFFSRSANNRNSSSLLKSIIPIVFALILISFITISIKGNNQVHRSPSSSLDLLKKRSTGFADALPVPNNIQTVSSLKEGTSERSTVAEPFTKEQSLSQTAANVQPIIVKSATSTGATSVTSTSKADGFSTSVKPDESSNSISPTSAGPKVPPLPDDGPPRRTRAKAFMVVFMGHSGSTAFITELMNHPAFEVKYLEPLDHNVYQRDTDLSLKFARQILDKGIANGKIPGFKVRPYHIKQNPKAFADLAKEYDIRIFWQFRVNIMKQAIGEYRHRVLNDTSVVEGLKKSETACDESSGYQCQFSIDDIPALHALLNDFSMNDDVLSDAVRLLKRDDHMLAVKYEDYLYRRDYVMKETFNFLGVDHMETEPLRIKASPDSLCGMVTNYQEVCRSFYTCQLWRPYLDDDRNGCFCRPSNGNEFDERYCHRIAWYQKRPN